MYRTHVSYHDVRFYELMLWVGSTWQTHKPWQRINLSFQRSFMNEQSHNFIISWTWLITWLQTVRNPASKHQYSPQPPVCDLHRLILLAFLLMGLSLSFSLPKQRKEGFYTQGCTKAKWNGLVEHIVQVPPNQLVGTVVHRTCPRGFRTLKTTPAAPSSLAPSLLVCLQVQRKERVSSLFPSSTCSLKVRKKDVVWRGVWRAIERRREGRERQDFSWTIT